MKTTKKVLQILLPIILLLTLLASCGGKEDIPWQKTTAKTSATTKSTPRATTTAATTEATTTPPTDLTFDGYEFIIAGERGTSGNTFFVTSATDAMTNQLIRTYEALEAELDIAITFVNLDSFPYEAIAANGRANKATADFVHLRHQYWIPLAVKGYIKPLNTDKIKAAGLDVSDPEQVDIYMTNASKQLDGENVWAFSVSGRYFSAPWGNALAFNKRLCEAAGYPAEDIYQMVRDHAWTWDKFEEICRAVSDPENNIYGYFIPVNETTEITSNIPINSLGNDGKWRTNADTDEFKTAVEWVIKIWNDPTVAMQTIDMIMSYGRQGYFYNGWNAFCSLWCGDFGYAYGNCNTVMTDDYGYIPFPMGPDATEYSHVILELYGFSLETANRNVDTSAYIMGRLASVLNDPDEYSTFARGVMRDDESVEMIMEYLLPNTSFNTARLCPETRMVVRDMVPQILRADSADAVCETFAQRMQAEIDKLFGY